MTAKAIQSSKWDSNAITAATSVSAGDKSATKTLTVNTTLSGREASSVLTAANYVSAGNKTTTMTLNLAANWNNAVNSVVSSVKKWLGIAAEGGVLSGGTWHVIPQFKAGGMMKNGKPVWWDSVQKYAAGTLHAGSMFVAGEAGPEIVGHINGRTEVLNKSQIASAIYSAVLAGMEAAVNSLGQYISQRMVSCSNAIISALIATRDPSAVTLSNADTALLQRLAALSAPVSYPVPAYAAGTIMPYEVVAEIRRQTSELKAAIREAAEEIIRANASAISNHGMALTQAIGNIQISPARSLDQMSITDSVIDEINRRTQMMGFSPLLM